MNSAGSNHDGLNFAHTSSCTCGEELVCPRAPAPRLFARVDAFTLACARCQGVTKILGGFDEPEKWRPESQSFMCGRCGARFQVGLLVWRLEERRGQRLDLLRAPDDCIPGIEYEQQMADELSRFRLGLHQPKVHVNRRVWWKRYAARCREADAAGFQASTGDQRPAPGSPADEASASLEDAGAEDGS